MILKKNILAQLFLLLISLSAFAQEQKYKEPGVLKGSYLV